VKNVAEIRAELEAIEATMRDIEFEENGEIVALNMTNKRKGNLKLYYDSLSYFKP
jgi:hypothetical protein